LSLQRKEAIEQLLRMSKGSELQIVGAAAEKLLNPKHERTRGTDNRLVSDERNVRAGVQCSRTEFRQACSRVVRKYRL